MRTSTGTDFEAGILGSPSSNGTGAFAPACYIGLSTDSTPPSANDVGLPGEIISGSLQRTLGTYAHTMGTSSYTLSAVFIADHTATITKIGIFNAQNGGILFLETLLPSAVTLNSGDQITISEVVSV